MSRRDRSLFVASLQQRGQRFVPNTFCSFQRKAESALATVPETSQGAGTESSSRLATGAGTNRRRRRRVLLLSWFALVLLLGSGAGCRRAPSPSHFYPIGIYGVRSTNDFARLHRAGFNLVCGPANRAYLDAAQAAGLKVLASPGTSAGPHFAPQVARRTVRAFDSSPALWGWYLVDEPDMQQIPPTEVRKANHFLKEVGAKKPTALVIYRGSDALYYANICDVTMVDRYPIPWLPLADFDQNVRLVRLALGPKKPLLAVLQAFDWSYDRQALGLTNSMRPPTYDELRCMAYCALAEQANGILFYTFNDGRWRLREHPRVWTAVKRVVSEIRRRLPLFAAQPIWRRFDGRFPRHDGFNAALASSISAVWLRVRRGNAHVGPGEYLVTVNNTARSLRYDFTVPEDESGRLPVFAEHRSLTVTNGWVAETYGPYAVHVYGPLPVE